ncbi:Ca(2+)-dependent cysteine protease [Tulasnella sp. 417]|nr:Ca(2+)-dependent cysteine protease [Tulasnella sp. 417]
MSRDTSIHGLPFSEDNRAVQRLFDLLPYGGLVQNRYTKVLSKKWDAFWETTRPRLNTPPREANVTRKRILVLSLSAYSHPRWPALQGPKSDWKFWVMLGMMSGWNVDVVADSLPAADSSRAPTKENIRRFIQALLKDNKAGDQFVLVYSGHGDTQGLVLADGSYVSHQELRTWLVKPLNSGSTLWTFFDCCESSNILGLPHKVSCDGNQSIRCQPAPGYVGRGDTGVRGTVISTGSAAGPSGEMDLTDSNQAAQCGPLAFAAYTFFCSVLKGGEPLLAKFWPSLTGLLKRSPGQEPQITASSILQNPLLPMLRPLSA